MATVYILKGVYSTMESRYDQYEESGDSDYDDDETEYIFATYAEIETDIPRVFGADGEYGESLGINFENIELIDGCLYADPDKNKFKLFSWQESNDMTPLERYEAGDTPSADDASPMIRKSYAGNTKKYELVAARVPETTDEDGETIIEPSSKIRDVEFNDYEDDNEYGDFEELGGDTVELPTAISWYNGGENGPSISAQNLAKALTEYGEKAVTDEDDVFDWLADTSGDNILRDDLEGRRFRFFVVQRDGEDYTYNLPIIEDEATGQQIRPDNRAEPDVSEIGESNAAQEASELDGDGTWPEPIADFLGTDLDLTEDRASKLLNELIEDADNALTQEMVEDNGGRDALINEVV